MNKAVVALASLATVVSFDALAQQPCAPREMIVQTLKDHGERLAAQGMSRSPAGPGVVEFFVSDQGGWTFVVTYPDGRSCLAAGGTDWTEKEKGPGI